MLRATPSRRRKMPTKTRARPGPAANTPGRRNTFSVMKSTGGNWNPLASLPKNNQFLLGNTGIARPKFNMYTPRRIEAITPREARSLPAAFNKPSKLVRPKTCLPRIKGSPPSQNTSISCRDAGTEAPRKVLGRVFANGKRVSLLPRASVPARRVCSHRLKYSPVRASGRERVVPRKPRPVLEVRVEAVEHNLQEDEFWEQPEHATAVTAGLLTEEQLEDLLTRELTPEDFELLLQLDELNDKKYKTVEKERFETFKEVPAPQENDYECRVCLELMKDDSIPEADEEPAVMLPCCGRIFHKECIAKWLKEYSKTCPSCRSDLTGF